MLLQLSHFSPSLHSILPSPSLPHSPPDSSCRWVILISSLASTFPILFLPYPCLFSTYHLCYLFSVPFLPLSPSHPAPLKPPAFPPLSSCPWVVHISSLSSLFPIPFFSSPIYLMPTNYASSLYISPLFLPSPPLKTLHVMSTSLILLLF